MPGKFTTLKKTKKRTILPFNEEKGFFCFSLAAGRLWIVVGSPVVNAQVVGNPVSAAQAMLENPSTRVAVFCRYSVVDGSRVRLMALLCLMQLSLEVCNVHEMDYGKISSN